MTPYRGCRQCRTSCGQRSVMVMAIVVVVVSVIVVVAVVVAMLIVEYVLSTTHQKHSSHDTIL